MHICGRYNYLTFVLAIGFVLCLTPCLFAQQESSKGTPKRSSTQESEKNLDVLQKQARFYRSQGLEAQRSGNVLAATSLYQKAIELDPGYADAYNDLGVIYEAVGFLERAEESYLKAIQIAPDYLSPYSNLAFLYERKRDLTKAAQYWKKRAELGLADDPWTKKAKQRYEDIRLIQADAPSVLSEQEVLGLMKDVINLKNVTATDNRRLSQEYFRRAQFSYERGDEVSALKQAIDAKELDPSNREIDKFIEKIQTRVLTR